MSQNTSQNGTWFWSVIIVAFFIFFEMVNANLFKHTHDRFEQIGDGLGVLGAALFVHNFPFSSDFVSNVLV